MTCAKVRELLGTDPRGLDMLTIAAIANHARTCPECLLYAVLRGVRAEARLPPADVAAARAEGTRIGQVAREAWNAQKN